MNAPATARVDSDNPDLAQLLDRLAALVVDHGGSFAAGFHVRAEGGELAIGSDGPNNRQAHLLTVPYALMPDCRNFQVRLKGTRLVAQPAADGAGVSDLQRHVMDAMLEVYNVTRKPRQWAAQSPWLTLWHDPDLLHRLVNQPADGEGGPAQLAAYRSGDWETTLVKSFLKSRTFNLKEGKDPTRTGTAEVLMPFIDFLNHHFLARGFQNSEELAGGALYTFQDRPVGGSNECFVRYNMMDIHTAFAGYGFLDESAPFSLSQIGTLKLDGGLHVEIRRQAAKGFKGKLPEGVRDLGIHMPQVWSPEADKLILSRLLIPGANAPRALRRVLGTLIGRKRPDWAQARVEAAVQEAERQLLELNHRYYDDLSDAVAGARQRSESDDPPGRKATLRMIDELVRRQKRHLYAYKDQLEAA